MKAFFLLFATVAMAVSADAATVIQASSIRMASNGLIVCPDQSSTCPTGSTCCKQIGGDYGCCGYPDATCCSDYKHCCPSGYRCDDESERCVKAVGNVTLPWTEKERASSMEFDAPAPVNTICPDGGTCPMMSTCCRTDTGSFSCCDFPNTCCFGGRQCCPFGSICDVSAKRCIRGFVKGARATPSQPAP